jgi:alkaline phosphatase D
MKRRELVVGGAVLAALGGCATSSSIDQPLRRIGFDSCFDQNNPQQGIFNAIVADRPDLFIFGGDNVYCRMPYSLASLREAYAVAATSVALQRLRASVPHMAIWDDHDYGINDGGAEFAGKHESKAEFLQFWKVPAGDPRRSREGLYYAESFGPADRRVQVIVLDVRWFRSPWKVTDQRNAPGKERYVPDDEASKTMLGEAQWRWLEEQLRQPAQVRLIVSGIQVVAEGHGWERWGNFPREREKLYRLIAATRAEGVVLLSGDRHVGGIYRETRATAYPLFEMTSSGITHTWREAAEAGPNRIGELFTELHFGIVDIDWEAQALSFSIKDIEGKVRRNQSIRFNELKATA